MTILFDEKDLLHNEFGKRNGNNNKKIEKYKKIVD